MAEVSNGEETNREETNRGYAAEPVRVARATAADWVVHRAVRLAMLLDSPSAYASTFEREVAFDREAWVTRMGESASWLAWRGGAPVGAVTLFQPPELRDSGAAYLVAMWVAAHARGTGVADALVEETLAHARTEGFTSVLLHVVEGNEAAAAVYRRRGFRPTGRSNPVGPHSPLVEHEMEFVIEDGALPANSQ